LIPKVESGKQELRWTKRSEQRHGLVEKKEKKKGKRPAERKGKNEGKEGRSLFCKAP